MTYEQEPLSDKRAVVTGASRGMGRVIALALADAGADVAVTARSLEELESVAETIESRGRNGLAVRCDVTQPDQVQEMAGDVVDRMGPPSILVNNAGTADSHALKNHPHEIWHRMLDINLNSVYYVTRAFLPSLLEHDRARVITNASVASKTGAPYIAAYTAAKHGVLGLMRCLAVELVDENLTANTICAGYVDTPMTDHSVQNISEKTGMTREEAREYLEKQTPQKRLFDPDEIASLVVYLARDISQGINGQAINVDGGELLW